MPAHTGPVRVTAPATRAAKLSVTASCVTVSSLLLPLVVVVGTPLLPVDGSRRSTQLGHRSSVRVAPATDLVQDLPWRTRVAERRRPHLHRIGACHQEL